MFVKNLAGAFSKFHLAGRTIKGVPTRLRDEGTSLARPARMV